MENKENKTDDFLKKYGNTISLLLALITGVAGILAYFLSPEDAKLVAAIVVLVGWGGVGLFQLYRRWRFRGILDQPDIPTSEKAILRGLLPFEEGDELLCREDDIKHLYTLVSSKAFKYGVLHGDSGCGKTSLLRAGLLPKLRNDKFLPIYIEKLTLDPLALILKSIKAEDPVLTKGISEPEKAIKKLTTAKKKKIILMIDQLDEYFAAVHNKPGQIEFYKWLGKVVNNKELPVGILLGIRQDYLAKLHKLHPHIAEPTSTRVSTYLENFNADQAKEFLARASDADEFEIKPEIIESVIRNLEVDGIIHPAEIQIVGERLKRKKIRSMSAFEAAGRSAGILKSYITEEIQASGQPEISKILLRMMCSPSGDAKAPAAVNPAEILEQVRSSMGAQAAHIQDLNEIVQNILRQFVGARIIIKTDEGKYNLVHDYLAKYIQLAAEGVETQTQKADRLLRRYIADYREESSARIPARNLRVIRKFATPELLQSSLARELIQKSRGRHLLYSMIPLLILVALVALGGNFYYQIQNSWYLSTEIVSSYDTDLQIVVMQGDPRLEFLRWETSPPIVTDFRLSDIPSYDLSSSDDARREILNKSVQGKWPPVDGLDPWIYAIDDRLSPVQSSLLQVWLGSPDAAKQFLSCAEQLSCSYGNVSFSDVFYVLNEAILLFPDLLQREAITGIVEASHLATYEYANLLSVVAANPKSLDVDRLSNKLLENTSYYDPGILYELALMDKTVITPDRIQELHTKIREPNLPVNDRFYGLWVILTLQELYPEINFRTADLLGTLIDMTGQGIQSIASYSSVSVAGEYTVFELIDKYMVTNAKRQSPEKIEALRAYRDDVNVATLKSILAAYAIAKYAEYSADRQVVTPDLVLDVLQKDFAADDGHYSGEAGIAISQLVQANPSAASSEVVREILTRMNCAQSKVNDLNIFQPTIETIVRTTKGRTADDFIVCLTRFLSSALADRFSDTSDFDRTASVDVSLQTLSTILRNHPEQADINTRKLLQEIAFAELGSTRLFDSQDKVRAALLLNELSQDENQPGTEINGLEIVQDYLRSQVGYFSIRNLGTLKDISDTNPELIDETVVRGVGNAISSDEGISRYELALYLDAIDLLKLGAEHIRDDTIADSLTRLGNHDARERERARIQLFFFAMADPDLKADILADLELKYGESTSPHERIAAARTIEMLKLAELFELGKKRPGDIPLITLRLNSWIYSGSDDPLLGLAAYYAKEQLRQFEIR